MIESKKRARLIERVNNMLGDATGGKAIRELGYEIEEERWHTATTARSCS